MHAAHVQPVQTRRPWLQFSLRTLFVLALIAASYSIGVRQSRLALQQEQVTNARMQSQIEKLERDISRLTKPRLTPDKHGILRDGAGREVGIWGVDDPSFESRIR